MGGCRLLIVSTSAGSGHLRAADALVDAGRGLLPDATIRHVDLLEFTSPLHRRAMSRAYLRLIDTVPPLWGYLYDAFDSRRAERDQGKIFTAIDWIESARFRRFIEDFAPDAVLATHFLGPQMLEPHRRRGHHRYFLGIVVTDFDAHSLWVQRTADAYFVGDDELRWGLAAKGVSPGAIRVTGIPISPAFSAPRPRREARSALALRQGVRTALVMGGGAGLGPLETAVEATLALPGTQVVAVAGRNREVRERLERRSSSAPGRLRTLGFVDNVEDVMAAADIAITKAGGLTSAECMALGLPMVVMDAVPGQEERNCDYLQEAGVALKAHGRASLEYKIRLLLTDRRRRERMSCAARRAARPEAARDVIRLTAHALGVPITASDTARGQS